MTKYEFLGKLRERLSVLPAEDREKTLTYYGEMLDDCMEDGMREEDAVASMGSVEEVAEQILSDVPLSHLVKERIRPKRKPGAFEIVLIVLGCPVWLSLLVAAAAVVLSLLIAFFAVLLSVIVSMWAIGASFVGAFVGSLACGVLMLVQGFVGQGLCFIGAGLLLVGLSILMYHASLYTTVGCGKFVKKMFFSSKHCLTKGGGNDA